MIALPGFILLVLVLWSFGDRVSLLARLQFERTWERFAWSTALSLGIVTILIFGLAVLKVVSLVSCLGLVATLAALSLRELKVNSREAMQGIRSLEWSRLLWPRGGGPGWAVWLTGLILFLGFIQTLAPVTGMDTGRMHFTAVKIMIREHGLLSQPDAWFHRTGGYYMIYLLGMVLQGEPMAKLLAFLVSLLVLLLTAQASERLRPGSGRLAAAIVALTPLFSGYTGYENLELSVLMYLLASYVAYERYRAEGGWGWAGAAGLMTGSALGVKITAFWSVVLLIPMISSAFGRDGRRAWSPLLAGALSFAVAAGFWPIWNRLTTGAFTYTYLEPFLEENPFAHTGQRWLAGTFKALGSLVTTSEYWIDSAGPFVIACLGGILIFRRPHESRLPAMLLIGSSVFYFGVLIVRLPDYLFIDAHARYLGPALLGFGALAAAPFFDWSLRGSSWLRPALMAALLLPAGPLVILKAGKAAVAAPAALGLESRSHYLGKKIETYEASQALNALPDESTLVLCVAQRPYYVDRRLVGLGIWEGVRSAEDLQRRIGEMGVTHVLFEPGTALQPWLKDPDQAFPSPRFREIGRWPWKQNQWVRLYQVEKS